MEKRKKLDLSQTGEIGRLIRRIDKEWMLLTAGSKERLNTMTASWGSVGVLWHKPMLNIFVRPERYTSAFIEAEAYFSAAFFPPEYQEALTFCGRKSGREVDKVAACEFTVAEGEAGGVYFMEADLVLICKKRYRAALEPSQMIDIAPGLFYGEHGKPHVMYMGEIVEVYTK